MRAWLSRAPRRDLLLVAAGAALWLAERMLSPPADAAPVTRAFLGWFIAAIIQVGQWIWDGIQSISLSVVWAIVKNIGRGLDYAMRAVGRGLEATGVLFARTVKLFRTLWQTALRPALITIDRWIRQVHQALTRIFAPLFRFLARVRVEFLKLYDRFIRPILDVISIARVILRTLGALGLTWAKALDARLASIESTVTGWRDRVLRGINDIAFTLERIVTFDFLLQRIALIRSMDRDAAYWVRIWWNKQIAVGAPIPGRDPTKPKYSRRPFDADLSELRTYVTGQEGPLAPKIRELEDALLFNFGMRPGLTVKDDE